MLPHRLVLYFLTDVGADSVSSTLSSLTSCKPPPAQDDFDVFAQTRTGAMPEPHKTYGFILNAQTNPTLFQQLTTIPCVCVVCQCCSGELRLQRSSHSGCATANGRSGESQCHGLYGQCGPSSAAVLLTSESISVCVSCAACRSSHMPGLVMLRHESRLLICRLHVHPGSCSLVRFCSGWRAEHLLALLTHLTWD